MHALEQAIWRRDTLLAGLVAHSDAGAQYTSIRYTDRLAEIGALPSIGTVGDSYDNAMAESTIGLYKSGTGLAARAMAHRRAARASHPRLHRMVQPPPPPRRTRSQHPSRDRRAVLPSPTTGNTGHSNPRT